MKMITAMIQSHKIGEVKKALDDGSDARDRAAEAVSEFRRLAEVARRAGIESQRAADESREAGEDLADEVERKNR